MIPQRLKDFAVGCSAGQKVTLNPADARLLGFEVPAGALHVVVTGKQLADAIARDGQPVPTVESPETATTAESENAANEPAADTKKPAKK